MTPLLAADTQLTLSGPVQVTLAFLILLGAFITPALAIVATVVKETYDRKRKEADDARADLIADRAAEVVVQAAEAARKVEGVAKKLDVTTATTERNHQQLDKKIDVIAETGEKNHKLLNSGMEAVLKELATARREIANLSGKSEDAKTADVAQDKYDDHHAVQSEIDATTAVVPAGAVLVTTDVKGQPAQIPLPATLEIQPKV